MQNSNSILKVCARISYWEDATINGQEDFNGTLLPFRHGDYWVPAIDLDAGMVIDWPKGTTADVYFKVCDGGTYLLDLGNAYYAWKGDYVPDKFLCHGDRGYGDYIILKVDKDGKIKDYCKPDLSDLDGWKKIEIISN
jgi:hypothetical protein